MKIILQYCWPGNVRELENAIEHAFVVCSGVEIKPEDFPEDIRESTRRHTICSERETGLVTVVPHPPKKVLPAKIGGRLNLTKADLHAALEAHGNNKKETASYLGISTVALWKKIKKMSVGQLRLTFSFVFVSLSHYVP
jgi:DNA-binding NtrC family response regulator